MAYTDGRVFVPVVDLCFPESAVTTTRVDSVDPSSGKGLIAALDATTGKWLWTRRFPSPDFGCATVANDVVFTSTFDGTVYGLSVEDGSVLWQAEVARGGGERARDAREAVEELELQVTVWHPRVIMPASLESAQ